jgi:hypothetical protein
MSVGGAGSGLEKDSVLDEGLVRESREPIMTKVVRVTPLHNRVLRLEFSDGSSGDYDLAPLIARGTSLTRALADDARFFLELGGLAWPNGFELAPDALHRQLKDRGALRPSARVV